MPGKPWSTAREMNSTGNGWEEVREWGIRRTCDIVTDQNYQANTVLRVGDIVGQSTVVPRGWSTICPLGSSDQRPSRAEGKRLYISAVS